MRVNLPGPGLQLPTPAPYQPITGAPAVHLDVLQVLHLQSQWWRCKSEAYIVRETFWPCFLGIVQPLDSAMVLTLPCACATHQHLLPEPTKETFGMWEPAEVGALKAVAGLRSQSPWRQGLTCGGKKLLRAASPASGHCWAGRCLQPSASSPRPGCGTRQPPAPGCLHTQPAVLPGPGLQLNFNTSLTQLSRYVSGSVHKAVA